MKQSISYCEHICIECSYLLQAYAVTSRKAFLEDETLKRAFVRSLEIIGEAVKQLPSDFRDKYPEVERHKMAGTKDRLIHDYLGVDYELVWDIVESKLPSLSKAIADIIRKEKQQER